MAVRLLTSEMEEKYMYMYGAALNQVCGKSQVHVCIIEVSNMDMRIENILYQLFNEPSGPGVHLLSMIERYQ